MSAESYEKYRAQEMPDTVADIFRKAKPNKTNVVIHNHAPFGAKLVELEKTIYNIRGKTEYGITEILKCELQYFLNNNPGMILHKQETRPGTMGEGFYKFYFYKK